MTVQTCSDCPAVLPHNPRRKGTRCKSCNARAIATSPEKRAALSKAMKRRWNDPQERRRLARAVQIGCLKPEVREERRRRGKIGCNARAAAAGSEARKKAGRTLSKTRLGWLPASYRDEYFRLRNNMKMPAPEARRIIEDQMFHDLAKYRDSGITPPPEMIALAMRRDAAVQVERAAELKVRD